MKNFCSISLKFVLKQTFLLFMKVKRKFNLKSVKRDNNQFRY